MKEAAEIAAFISGQERMMTVLAAIEKLNVPGAWAGAGFVRNAVWDHLHGRSIEAAWSDIDVVYSDRDALAASRDTEHEERLRSLLPGLPWSVKNQARMHVRNGDRPYADLADALAHWPETCTAVAARRRHRRDPSTLWCRGSRRHARTAYPGIRDQAPRRPAARSR